MVTYNPKDWLKLIFHFHKSDTLRILGPNMLILGVITAVFCYLEEHYFSAKIPSLTIFHQISGFIISLVLVFRINTAYDRWWEGRKLWGTLINNSRSISIELHSMIPLDDIYTRSKIVSFLSSFAFMLKEHLRNNYKPGELSFNDSMHEAELTASSHKPSFIAARFSRFIYEYCRKNGGDHNNFLIVERNINEFSEICGACERIKSTPIPYSYSIFIKKLIFVYIITMPITFGLSVGYWSVPMVMIIFYAFASLELLSEEIEDPFGTDSNDLPTDEIAAKIKVNVSEILLENATN
jgi:ion channel-forming bestrophin family protein